MVMPGGVAWVGGAERWPLIADNCVDFRLLRILQTEGSNFFFVFFNFIVCSFWKSMILSNVHQHLLLLFF